MRVNACGVCRLLRVGAMGSFYVLVKALLVWENFVKLCRGVPYKNLAETSSRTSLKRALFFPADLQSFLT